MEQIDFKEKAILAKNNSEFYSVLDSIASCDVDGDGYVVMDSESIAKVIEEQSNAQMKILKKNNGISLEETERIANLDTNMRLQAVRDSYGVPMTYTDQNRQTRGLLANYNEARHNISFTYFTPREASRIYSSCGLPMHIIDKKASAVFLNGLNFRCKGINQESMSEFIDYARSIGFFDACATALTQSLVYGGSLLYPIFHTDNPYSFMEDFNPYDFESFKRAIPQKKDFIKEFAVIDRWNTVVVPEYSPMASDYINTGCMFIPVDGISLNMSRASKICWKRTSYWESIMYMGWCPSDFSGWIESYLQYRTMQSALPKMAMQSSLLYSYVPIDSVLMQNGTDDVRELQRLAQESIDEIDVNNAKVFNSVGELRTIERTYSGFNDIFKENRVSLSADCGLPVSVVFEEAPSGLASDREEDITLKKAECIKRIWNSIEKEITKQAIILGYSFFGVDSEEAENLRYMVVEANSHTAESTKQKADVAYVFSQTIQNLSIAGITPKDGIKLVERFFPEIPMSEEQEENLDKTFSELQNMQKFDERSDVNAD